MEVGPSPLPSSVHDLAPVMLRYLLMAEAEAQDGRVEVVDLFVVVGVFALGGQAGVAGDDDSTIAMKGVDRIFRLADFCMHATAANLGSDEVGVLPSEVYDGDAIVCHCTCEWG